ncbi:anaerobic ribonucleoside-triphosphate reductase activating protein [Candidatus Bathyarchaeota archaeon]|nr:anaerobic ribonucleoside-triphosphate reductase activating protein [Candidatus Bathyarchaeota archaeon]
MRFGGLQKTSLIDFPDRISTVLFTVGCNLRCPFCHNWRLVLEPEGPFLSESEVLETLRSRRKYIDSVVITGGEPTLNQDLPAFLKKLKEEGFAVKLDTNGFFPQTMERCLPHVDYVALDVKTSLDKYRLLGAEDTSSFLRSVEILKSGAVDYEFRCTVVPGFVDEEDVKKMGELVKGAKRFVFQQFVPDDTLDKSLRKVEPYTREVILHFSELMRKYVKEVSLRV